jgi:GTPase SAR1 family protein
MYEEQTAAEYVDHLLEMAIRDTAASPALAPLHTELIQSRHRLQQPMRVAIVGLIKAGKSTLMNALLGEAVVATGTIETTFNVNWLRYGEQPSLKVHFKGNRPPESRPFKELAFLTQRAEEQRQLLTSIKYIEVFFPNEMLRMLQLIDTPGLESVHEDDSQNTRDFILTHGHELSNVTLAETSNADAVLYLFSQSISSSGASILEEFQGPLMGTATPLNSIGVLTRADVYWPDEQEPLAVGRRIARRLQADHPQMQQLLYTIVPVSGLLALGIQTLTESEFATLIELAALPEQQLKRGLKYAKRFAEETLEDVPIAPERRKALLRRLGQYGIWRAYQHLRTGAQSLSQLRELLLAESGLTELQTVILSHFGKRSFLIKLDNVLRHIASTTLWMRRQVQGRDLEVVRSVIRTFEELAAKQEGLSLLRVLRSYYKGKLAFTPEEGQQLLQVAGEYGTTYRQRLGISQEEQLSIETRLETAIAVAQEFICYWRQRSIDPGLDSETSNATEVMARAYEYIAYHLCEAMRHLNLPGL